MSQFKEEIKNIDLEIEGKPYNLSIPKKVFETYRKLKESGHQAYLVGGCLRDLILEREPKDWDIATSAKPEEIQKLFPESFYDNKFFTVKIPFTKESFIEITTFRSERKYTDKRHPEVLSFAKTIQEDLKRRDFTINAFALDLEKKEFIDLFSGLKDLKNKLIRTVGKPEERFQEDALRLLRAIRFAAQLQFEIEPNTYKAIKENAHLLSYISKERIRDELVKIIMTKHPEKSFLQLQETGLLKYIIPELEEGIGIAQGGHHKYDVFTHSILSLEAAAKRNYNLEVRLAALLHDVGKPRTKDYDSSGKITFYNHQIVGAKMAKEILKRLRFDKKTIEKVALLVREHMFVYDIGKVTERGVRRLLRKVGKENIQDLINLRIADRIGSGTPKAVPYRLRHLIYMLEKVSSDPISLKMLALNGNDVIETLKIEPSPRVGLLLDALLVKVLDNPQLNKKELLKEELIKLNQLSDEELKELRKELDYKKKQADISLRKKYHLKETD